MDASVTGSPSRADSGIRDQLPEALARERGLERDGVFAPRHGIRPDGGMNGRREQFLGQIHQVVVVGVRPIELEHGELRVPAVADAFIPEVAIDLENLLDAADHEALEVELWRNPQEELHVECVVMRHKRPRERTARNRLHHRRLDLEKPAGDEKLPHRGNRPATDLEHVTHVGIHHQIEIPLAVPNLDILKAMPLFRQRDEALREELQAGHPDRELVRLGTKQVAGDPDVIAVVEQLRHGELGLAERILPDVRLNPTPAVGEHEETGLSETADAEDSAGAGSLDPRRLEVLLAAGAVLVDQCADGMSGREAVRVRTNAQLRDRLEIGAPLFGLLFFVRH